MNIVVIIFLIGIVVLIGLIAYADTEERATIQPFSDTHSIQCTTTITFLCATISLNYNSDSIRNEFREDITLDSIPIPMVSEEDMVYLDGHSGDFVVCKQNMKCIIEMEIELFNELGSLELPYDYSLILSLTDSSLMHRQLNDSTLEFVWNPTYADSKGELIVSKDSIKIEKSFPLVLVT
jgi:hypothetical protein